MTSPGGRKAELRAQFLAERRALLAEDVKERSRAIADRLFTLPFLTAPTITELHVFLPIQRHNEVDTWPIIHRIWRDYPAINLAVSVTDVNTNRLSHYRFTSDTPLIENRWGIPEPTTPTDDLHPATFDAVLVPLLAFDQRGHRVGYGRGYYDRFLAECRPECQKIGLSLFEPVERIDDVNEMDVKLSVCFTPTDAWLFRT